MVVMSSVYSFELIVGVVFSFYTRSTDRSDAAQSQAACAAACGAHSSSGGFVWDTVQTPPCLLVMLHSETGATVSSSTSAYRMSNYGRGTIRNVYHGPGSSWQDSVTQCTTASPAMRLLPYVTNSRELAILSIRRGDLVHVDLQLATNGLYVDQNGTEVGMSQITWCWVNPQQGNEKCGGVSCKETGFVDHGCTSITPAYNYDVLCLG